MCKTLKIDEIPLSLLSLRNCYIELFERMLVPKCIAQTGKHIAHQQQVSKARVVACVEQKGFILVLVS
jgi:adenine/guanine phosphoribosyltransferase-like PRPP-binding protein